MSSTHAFASAEPQHSHDVPQNTVKHVSFALGDESYAINASKVNEVLRFTEITPVPGAASFILGIINLRGNVVTVVDARSIFALPAREITPNTRIIVVEVEDFIVGVLVDRVAAVVDLNEQAIEVAPHTGIEAAARFIHGVYNEEDDMLILVDFTRLLDLLPR